MLFHDHCLSGSNPSFCILLWDAGTLILKNTFPRQLCHLVLPTGGVSSGLQPMLCIRIPWEHLQPKDDWAYTYRIVFKWSGESRYHHLTSPTGHSNTPTDVKATAPEGDQKAEGEKGLLLSTCLMFLTAWPQHWHLASAAPLVSVSSQASTHWRWGILHQDEPTGDGASSIRRGSPSCSITTSYSWALMVPTGGLHSVFPPLTLS